MIKLLKDILRYGNSYVHIFIASKILIHLTVSKCLNHTNDIIMNWKVWLIIFTSEENYNRSRGFIRNKFHLNLYNMYKLDFIGLSLILKIPVNSNYCRQSQLVSYP